MRLNLNKTLRAALIAAITAVGTTLPQALASESVEYTDMLKGDTYTWTKGNGTIDSSAGTFTCNGWNDGWADHKFANELTLTATTDVLNFSYDITIGHNAYVTLTLVSSNGCTITTGWGGANEWNRVGYGTSTSTATDALYQFKDAGAAHQVQVTEIDHFTSNTSRPYNSTVEGTIAWSDQSSSYVLTLNNTPSGGSTETKTLDLGKQKLTFTDIIVGVEGKPNETYYISNVGLSATYTVPTVTSLVWKGKEGSSNWSDFVWGETGDQPFVAGTDAVFDNTATSKTVGVTEDVSAGKVTVSDAYAFNLTGGNLSAEALAIEEGGSLAITGSHTMDVSGAVSAVGTLSVGEGTTLKVGNGQKDLMVGTAVTNNGTFVLASDVSLGDGESSRMGGTLAIQNATVTLGGNEAHTASIASFDQVSLDGGQITVNAQNATVNGVSVATGKTGTVKVEDMKNSPNTVTLAGITRVDGTLNLTNNWNSSFTIEQLSGAGTLNQPAGGQQEMLLTISSLDGFTGSMVLKHNKNSDAININTGSTAVNFKALELAIGGHTANFTLGADTTIGQATLTSGSLALAGADTHTLTLGGLDGGATITGLNNLVLNVTEGTHEYTGTFAVAGQITKTGAGSQTITGTALHHTIMAEGGTLVLNGTYEIKDIAEGEHQTIYVDADDQESPNGGFMKNTGSLTVYTVNTEAGAQLNLGNAVFTYDGNVVTEDVQDGAYTLPSAPILSTVYVKDGSLAFAAFKAKAGEALTTVSLANNTTIDMDEAATIELVLESGANATVNATAATTLNAVTGLAAAQQLVVSGDETVTLGSAVTGNKILVNNGHLNLGTLTHSLSELSVSNGTVDVGGVDSKYGCVSGTLTIGESGTVTTVGHHDVFGYNDGATDKIVLRGAENKLAQLVLNSPNANSVTMTTDIEMYGYSAITSSKGDSDKGFNTYGGTIKVEGLENSISVLDMRHNGVTIDVAENGALEIKKVTIFGNQHGANTILVKAGEGALTLSGASDLTDGLTINAGSVEIGGESTIGNLAGTGDLVVKAGGSLNVTGSVTDTTITVEDGGTIAGGVDAKNVGIEAGARATFDEGVIDEDAGISIVGWESGATVTNDGATTAKYAGLQDSNMTVAAEGLYSLAERDVDINNALEVGVIMHEGTGALTLTRVNGATLTAVSTDTANLTIGGVEETSLTDLSIGAGATVAVYVTDAEAGTEGTVTVQESLTAGGGTLKANLVLAGGSTLDLQTGDDEMTALTLGSKLAFVEGGLVTLDGATLYLLDQLVMGSDSNYLELVHAANGTTLAYGEDGTAEYNGMWFGQLFDRPDTLVGDFQVVANGTSFGLTKVSNVPEPTTGTLSLLALAALCMRRRRK